MPQPDVQDAATPESPAPPLASSGTVQPGFASLSEYAAMQTPPDEAAPPDADSSGDDGPMLDEDEIAADDPGKGPLETKESGTAPGSDLIEVEVMGVKTWMTPADKRVFDAEQKADLAKREQLEAELKYQRKLAGQAKRQKGKPETDGPDGDGVGEVRTPPKPETVTMDSVLEAFGRFETSGKPEDLRAAFDAHKRHILSDPATAETLTVGGIPMVQMLRSFHLDVEELRARLDGLTGEHQQVIRQVQPDIERSNVRTYARTEGGFDKLANEAIDAAYEAAKPLWTAEIKELGLDPTTIPAQRLMRRILNSHLQQQAAALEAEAKPKAKGDLAGKRTVAPGPRSAPASPSSDGALGGYGGLAAYAAAQSGRR